MAGHGRSLQPGMLRLTTIEFGADKPAARLADRIERLTGKRHRLREVRWLSRFGHPTATGRLGRRRWTR